MLTRFVTSCLCLVLGCGSPPSGAGETGSTKAAADPQVAAPTCSAEPLEATMLAYCDFEASVPTDSLAAVAWAAPPFHLLEQRLVVVDAEGFVVGLDATRRPIAAWLDEPAEDGVMVLAIADGLPAALVAELFAGLHERSRTELSVLVRTQDPATPVPQPPNPVLLAEIGRRLPSDLSQRAMQLATKMGEYAKACPRLSTALQNLASVAPAERCSGMALGVSSAIAECECEQGEEIMTLIYAITVGTTVPKGRVAAVPLTLDPAAAVTAASTATWGQVAGDQLTGAKPHRFWVNAAE